MAKERTFLPRVTEPLDPNAPHSELEKRVRCFETIRDGLQQMIHDDYVFDRYGKILYALDNIVDRERLETIRAASAAYRKLVVMEQELVEAVSFRSLAPKE